MSKKVIVVNKELAQKLISENKAEEFGCYEEKFYKRLEEEANKFVKSGRLPKEHLQSFIDNNSDRWKELEDECFVDSVFSILYNKVEEYKKEHKNK